jgi:hypothetical protein
MKLWELTYQIEIQPDINSLKSAKNAADITIHKAMNKIMV